MIRLPSVFQTDEAYGTAPLYNLNLDHTARALLGGVGVVGLGHIGAVYEDRKLAEGTQGNLPGVYKICNTFSHWFSGGEYTLPISGVECAIYSERGVGAILGYVPAPTTKSYYRLAYTKSVKPDALVSPIEGTINNSTSNTGGYPKDIIHGDQGFQTIDGYSYGVLSGGPVYLQANPFAKVECFDIDDSVRISSLNFKHITGQSIKESVTSYKKGISNYSEYGKCTDIDPIEEAEGETINHEEDDLFTESQYFKHTGSIGNFYSFCILDKYYNNISEDGRSYSKSLNDIILSVGDLPTFTGVNPAYDPSKNTNTTKTPEFNWQNNGRISQELFYLYNINNYVANQFIKEKEETQSDSIEIKDSIFHLRDDGSIIIMSKSGSSIELNAEGDIIITPKRHLMVQSGKNTSIISGGYTNIVSKDTVSLRSTDNNIQSMSKNKHSIYTEREGIILETPTTQGITLSAERGTINNYGFMINNESKAYLRFKSKLFMEEGISKSSTYKTVKKTHNVETLKGSILGITSAAGILMNSAALRWKGQSFILGASSAGTIRAGSPVNINHNHFEGQDAFYRRKILKGMSVYAIKKLPVGAGGSSIPILPDFDIPNVVVPEVELDTTYSEDEQYYMTPWQYTTSGSWGTIGVPVKSTNVFPINNKFYMYNGKSFDQLQWSQYRIN